MGADRLEINIVGLSLPGPGGASMQGMSVGDDTAGSGEVAGLAYCGVGDSSYAGWG